MTYTQRKAVRLLDHAIDHVCGDTPACPLFVLNGRGFQIPAKPSLAAEVRAILADAMVAVVREAK